MADGQEERDTHDEENMEDVQEDVPIAPVIIQMWYCSVCKKETNQGGSLRKCKLMRGTTVCGKTLRRRCDSNNGHCREAHYYGTDMDAHRVAQHPEEWPKLDKRDNRKRMRRHHKKHKTHKRQKKTSSQQNFQYIDVVLAPAVAPVAPVAVVVRGVAAAPIGSPMTIRESMNVIEFQSELIKNWTFDTFPFPESYCKVYSLVGGFKDITEGMSVFSFINLM